MQLKDKYYGHPNTKPCFWHNRTDPSTKDYQDSMIVLLSSAVGMTENLTDDFDSQIRGNLIHANYRYLLRVL